MSVFINILISLIAACFLTAITFLVISRVKGNFMNIFHAAIHICIFLFVFVQSFLFMEAWDIKSLLQDLAQEANAIGDSCVGIIKQFDGGSEAIDQLAGNGTKIDVNPILNLFGIGVGENGFYANQRTLDYYNSYMWHRVFWTFGVIVIYILICMFTLHHGGYKQTYQRNHHYASHRRRRNRI